METNLLVGADVEGKDGKQRAVKGNCDDLQRIAQLPASAESDSQSESPECKHDVPEDIPVNGNAESSPDGVECEDKVLVPTDISEKFVESSSTNGLEPIEYKDCAQEWKFDKSLPPIKVRREGQSCDSSPSDLSPPSPKRMKSASQERDQWVGLWSADEKK